MCHFRLWDLWGAQNFTRLEMWGDREKALLAFYDCKALMMRHYETLHGGSSQRDISYLLALQRLLSNDLGPPEDLRILEVNGLASFGLCQLDPAFVSLYVKASRWSTQGGGFWPNQPNQPNNYPPSQPNQPGLGTLTRHPENMRWDALNLELQKKTS